MQYKELSYQKVINDLKPQIKRMALLLEFDKDELNRLFEPVVNKAIKAMVFVPASRSDHHSYPYGLINHSFEVAETSLRNINALLVINSQEANHNQKRKAHLYFAWLVGMFHDLGKIISDFQIINKETSQISIFDPYQEDLDQWLIKQNNLQFIELTWNNKRDIKHKSYSLELIKQEIEQLGAELLFIPAKLDWKNHLKEIFINPTHKNFFYKILISADSSSVIKDIKRNPPQEFKLPWQQEKKVAPVPQQLDFNLLSLQELLQDCLISQKQQLDKINLKQPLIWSELIADYQQHLELALVKLFVNSKYYERIFNLLQEKGNIAQLAGLLNHAADPKMTAEQKARMIQIEQLDIECWLKKFLIKQFKEHCLDKLSNSVVSKLLLLTDLLLLQQDSLQLVELDLNYPIKVIEPQLLLRMKELQGCQALDDSKIKVAKGSFYLSRKLYTKQPLMVWLDWSGLLNKIVGYFQQKMIELGDSWQYLTQQVVNDNNNYRLSLVKLSDGALTFEQIMQVSGLGGLISSLEQLLDNYLPLIATVDHKAISSQ